MRREAFQRAVSFQRDNYLVLDLGGCPLSGLDATCEQRLKALFGFSGYESRTGYGIDERILQALDIDTRGVGRILRPKKSAYKRISDTQFIDAWGIGKVFTGLYWDIVSSPLQGATVDDLLRFPFPDPETLDVQELDEIPADAKRLYETTDYIVCASHPVYGVFELACWLCGFEDFMLRLILDPEFVEILLRRIFAYQCAVTQQYYSRVGPYIHYTTSGDDFATQQSTFLSPQMFRDTVFPFFAQRIALTKSLTPAKFLHHSCGNVAALIPALIEAGVDILNPIQPTGTSMQPAALKAQFGGKIVFHGGLDTQALLPQGSKEQIEQGVHALIDAMSGGGYLFAAAHNLQSDVPPENIVTMFTAARAHAKSALTHPNASAAKGGQP